MTDLINKIEAQIKSQKIKPIPKWEILAKRSVVWIFLIISIIFGSLAFSIILFEIKSVEWDIYEKVAGNKFSFLLATIPYIWFIFMVLFIYLTYLEFKKTQKGYKIPVAIVIGSSLFCSIIFGSLIYSSSFSEEVEEVIRTNVPTFHKIASPRTRIWLAPKQGLLNGRVLTVNQRLIIIQDPSLRLWTVDLNQINSKKLLDQIKPGQEVRIIGEIINPTTFRAQEIRSGAPGPTRRIYIRINMLKELPELERTM